MLCLGPTPEIALAQAVQALGAGCAVVVIAPDVAERTLPLSEAGLPIAAFDGVVELQSIAKLDNLAAVAASGVSDWTSDIRKALAARSGPITPLETQTVSPTRYFIERHLCIDTTAAGGNASLLASVN